MKQLFRMDSPFIHHLSNAADLIFLNFLTVILSLPIVTIGAAVTALYDAVWRIQQNEGNIYKAYFLAFKNNFKQATAIWLILFAAGALIVVSILFYVTNNLTVFLVISAALMLLWSITISWVFPLLSRFGNTVFATLKNAALCGIGCFPRSLIMSVLNLLPWIILLFLPSIFIQLGLIWIFIWFALAVYFNMKLIRKPFAALSENTDDPEPCAAHGCE